MDKTVFRLTAILIHLALEKNNKEIESKAQSKSELQLYSGKGIFIMRSDRN